MATKLREVKVFLDKVIKERKFEAKNSYGTDDEVFRKLQGYDSTREGECHKSRSIRGRKIHTKKGGGIKFMKPITT